MTANTSNALWLVVVLVDLVLGQDLVCGAARRAEDVVARLPARLSVAHGRRGGWVLALVEAGGGAEAAVCAAGRRVSRELRAAVEPGETPPDGADTKVWGKTDRRC